MAEKITPRGTDYAKWYLDVVKQAGLADNSDVRGCMVIKPTGYAVWENMQRALDRMFKDTGHVNAYFPLFIPEELPRQGRSRWRRGSPRSAPSSRHYRLKAEKGKGAASSIPTRSSKSRTDHPANIGNDHLERTYKNWIQSYRDLPLLINQWCERRPLGDAHTFVSAHGRVSVAGRSHGPRHRQAEAEAETWTRWCDVYQPLRRGMDGNARARRT